MNEIQTILQIRQQPDSYGIGQHTLSEWNDPNIPNNQIEWYTKRRGVHFITGILIQFESNHPGLIEYIERFTDYEQKKIFDHLKKYQ